MKPGASILMASVVLSLVLGCQSNGRTPSVVSGNPERTTLTPAAPVVTLPIVHPEPTTTTLIAGAEATQALTAKAGVSSKTPSDSMQSGADRRMAFLSKREGSVDVWWMDSTGANLQRLTNDNWIERGLSWSPNATAIAYATRPSASAADSDQLWVLDISSRQRRQLVEPDLVGLSAPTWSSDGHTIAFSAWAAREPGIWLVDLDTGGQVQISRHRHLPIWSPDRRYLAVLGPPVEEESGFFSPLEYFSIIASSGEPLGHVGRGWDWQKHVTGMAWSHTGDRLLVSSEAGKSFMPGVASLEIVVVDDKTASIAVNHMMECNDYDCDFYSPAWFPGDKEILFIAAVPLPFRAPYDTPEPDGPEGKWWIYRATATLSSMQAVLESDLPISDASLSPDGTQVVFVRGEYADAEIWVLDLSTGQAAQLTNNDVDDSQPVWQPGP